MVAPTGNTAASQSAEPTLVELGNLKGRLIIQIGNEQLETSTNVFVPKGGIGRWQKEGINGFEIPDLAKSTWYKRIGTKIKHTLLRIFGGYTDVTLNGKTYLVNEKSADKYISRIREKIPTPYIDGDLQEKFNTIFMALTNQRNLGNVASATSVSGESDQVRTVSGRDQAKMEKEVLEAINQKIRAIVRSEKNTSLALAEHACNVIKEMRELKLTSIFAMKIMLKINQDQDLNKDEACKLANFIVNEMQHTQKDNDLITVMVKIKQALQ